MVMVNGAEPSSGGSRSRAYEGPCCGEGGFGVGGGGLLEKG